MIRSQRDDLPATPSAGLALVPGVLLTFLGTWTLSEGELPQALGWAGVVVGVTLLLIGAIARGVSWGLDLHETGGS